jgi:hypothetical protein
MTNSLYVSKNELQILLNLFDNPIQVSYPFYDFNLVEGFVQKDGVKLSFHGTSDLFRRNQSQFAGNIDEMPSFNDVLDILLYSGIITYDNIFRLDSLIEDVSKWPDNRKGVFCPDTNVFYHLFLRNYQRITDDQIVLIETVGEEINAARSHQLSDPTHGQIMNSITRQKEWFTPLQNTLTKKSRRAQYLAYAEYQYYKQHALHTYSGVRKSTHSNDENDQIIVDTAKQIKQNRYPDLYLMTADKGVKDRCDEADVNCILLKIPRTLITTKSTFSQFNDFISALSRVFCLIKINSTIIYGDFSKKNQNNYDKHRIDFQHKPVYDECKKHLHVCRKINEIGIPVGE